MRSKANPFARAKQYYRVQFGLHADGVGTAEEAFSDVALSVASFEVDEAKRQWLFELVFDAEPDIAEIKRRLLILEALHGVAATDFLFEPMQEQDWALQINRDFPPTSVGRFYLRGSHVKSAPPIASIPITVDAGAAFGSGEHGTTRGCMQALLWLSKRRRIKSLLDVGTGSGILAIAAAKLWPALVHASDIDPEAVLVAKRHIKANRARVVAFPAEGYLHKTIQRQQNYDVIVANILARPLVALAPQLARHLAPGGVAILSGLLVEQEQMVLNAHRMQGLYVVKRLRDGAWSTLVLAGQA